jgi:hypothetical protein
MPARAGALVAVRRIAGRALPRGPLDLVWQLLLIAAAYYGWRYARGAVDGGLAESFAHASDLVAIERDTGTLIEADVQRWALDLGWPAELARWMYANAHFKGSCAALLFIYFFRPGSYRFVRNMVVCGMAISLLGYALYPTAPPRFLPELGLDGGTSVTGNSPLLTSPGDPLFNPFAAVPSMHVGLALMFGCSLALLVQVRAVQALLLAYPLLITYVVVATGNHFWLDALFGAMAAALAAGAALTLARLRPDWAFGGGRTKTGEAEHRGAVQPHAGEASEAVA